MACNHYAPVHPIDNISTSQYLSRQVSCNDAEDYMACIAMGESGVLQVPAWVCALQATLDMWPSYSCCNILTSSYCSPGVLKILFHCDAAQRMHSVWNLVCFLLSWTPYTTLMLTACLSSSSWVALREQSAYVSIYSGTQSQYSQA